MSILSEPELIEPTTAHGQTLLEAPRADDDGSLLYSDVMGGGVHRLTPDGGIEEVLPLRRGIGGMVIHRDGGLVVSGRSVIHAGGGEERELLALDGVFGFNDLHADAQGRVYAGALRFHPFKGEDPVPGEIWRIDAPGSAEPVAEEVRWANGLGFSPDGARMYVSDYADAQVLVYEGSAKPDVFARSPEGSTDGLAVDEEGGVWVALGEGGIARFEPSGELDGVVKLPDRFVSSLSFGGPDLRDVWITTAGAVFSARSEIAGLPGPRAAI